MRGKSVASSPQRLLNESVFALEPFIQSHLCNTCLVKQAINRDPFEPLLGEDGFRDA